MSWPRFSLAGLGLTCGGVAVAAGIPAHIRFLVFVVSVAFSQLSRFGTRKTGSDTCASAGSLGLSGLRRAGFRERCSDDVERRGKWVVSDFEARAQKRNERWKDTQELLTSRRPMTPAEEARYRAAVNAYYDGNPTVEDVLVRAETELRYACHVDTCNCSATAMRANLALNYVREGLALVRASRVPR